MSNISPPTTDPDDELVSVPRWVIGVLAEELESRTDCGPYKSFEPRRPRCEAIRIGLEACDNA